MCVKIPLMLRLPFCSEPTNGGKYRILGDGEDLTDRPIAMKNTYSLSKLGNNIRVFARESSMCMKSPANILSSVGIYLQNTLKERLSARRLTAFLYNLDEIAGSLPII